MRVVDLATCREGKHSIDLVQGQSPCNSFRAPPLIRSLRRQAEHCVCVAPRLACRLCVDSAAAVNGPLWLMVLGWHMDELRHKSRAHCKIIFPGVQIMRQPRCSPASPQHHHARIACTEGHLSDASDGMHAAA